MRKACDELEAGTSACSKSVSTATTCLVFLLGNEIWTNASGSLSDDLEGPGRLSGSVSSCMCGCAACRLDMLSALSCTATWFTTGDD